MALTLTLALKTARRPLVLTAIFAGAVFLWKASDTLSTVSLALSGSAMAADPAPEAEAKPTSEDDAVLVEAPPPTISDDPAMMSQSELSLLRDLGKRRSDLDARERDLDMRSRLLEAAEKRVEAKIADLKALEDRVGGLLVKHENQENEKLASVVKVYEKMKPADAARILQGLSMDIQVDVAMRMSELRMAPILAKMKATSAQKLTTQLATKQVLDLSPNVN